MKNAACLLFAMIWVEFSVAQFRDVKINEPPNDPEFYITNQAEPEVSVSPSYSNLLCASWTRQSWTWPPPTSWPVYFVGYALSADKGVTWGTYEYWRNTVMPSVAWDRGGELGTRLHCVYTTLLEQGEFGRIYHRLLSDFIYWGVPLPISSRQSDQMEPKIVVDNNTQSPFTGRAYIAWNSWEGGQSYILFRYLVQGESWELGEEIEIAVSHEEKSDPDAVSHYTGEGGDLPRGVKYPDVVVAPNGDVYVAWMDDVVGVMNIRRSTDGGRNFGGTVDVFSFDWRGVMNVGQAFATMRPSLAVSPPPNEDVFLAASDRRPGDETGDPIVCLFRSEDQGSSWRKIWSYDLGIGHQHFFPNVAITPKGGIYVSFMNAQGQDHVSSWIATSDDDGSTFAEVSQVSVEFSTTPLSKIFCYYDADIGSGYSDEVVFPVWTDHREAEHRPYVASMLTTTIHVPASWRMMGLPHYLSSYYKADVFPGASAVDYFAWSAGYQSAPDPLEPDQLPGWGNIGYWVRFTSEQNQRFFGSWKERMEMTVNDGWNIIGSISGGVAPGDVIPSPGVTVTSPYFGFDGGYYEAEALEPGQGYWVKVSGNGTLLLYYPEWTFSRPIANYPVRTNPNVEQLLDEFTVIDSAGFKQHLFVARSGDRIEMPPEAPNGAGVNVRFASGNFREVVESSAGLVALPISLNRVRYPVTFKWLIHPQNRISYWVRNGNIRSALDTAGSITIRTRANGIINLEARATGLGKLQAGDIPTCYGLKPSFPNPFNPTTEIGFDLPEASNISLTIYDMLGREVAQVANGYREAGYHTATWNASNQSSGVYFARFRASDIEGRVVYSKVNKIVLMR